MRRHLDYLQVMYDVLSSMVINYFDGNFVDILNLIRVIGDGPMLNPLLSIVA